MAIKGRIRNEWVEALIGGTLDKEDIPADILVELKEKYKRFEHNSGMKDSVVKLKAYKKAMGVCETSDESDTEKQGE